MQAVRRLVKEQDVDGLLAALSEEKALRAAWRRIRLVSALGKLGDPKAVEPLSMLLESDPSAEVRGMAAISLGLIGDRSAAPAVKRALGDPGEWNGPRAIRSLGALRDRGSVSVFIGYLDLRWPETREAAADALGDIGDQAAVPRLIEALTDSNLGVRQAAAIALAKLGDARALEPLRSAHRSATVSRRRMAKALVELEARLQGTEDEERTASFDRSRARIELERTIGGPSLMVSSVWTDLKRRAGVRRNLREVIYLGQGLFLSGRHDETLGFLQKAVGEFPEDPEIRVLYASILLAFRLDEVAAEAATAIELGPDDPKILVRAGGLLLGRGETESARSALHRARELAPPDFIFMSGLENLTGLIASLDGDLVLAEERLRFAVEGEPTNGPFARNLAVFLAEQKRLLEAVAVLDEALKHVSDKEDLERLRGQMKAACG